MLIFPDHKIVSRESHEGFVYYVPSILDVSVAVVGTSDVKVCVLIFPEHNIVSRESYNVLLFYAMSTRLVWVEVLALERRTLEAHICCSAYALFALM